jgi:hypothetical protein
LLIRSDVFPEDRRTCRLLPSPVVAEIQFKAFLRANKLRSRLVNIPCSSRTERFYIIIMHQSQPSVHGQPARHKPVQVWQLRDKETKMQVMRLEGSHQVPLHSNHQIILCYVRTLHSMTEMLCRPNFLTRFSPVIFSCFATRWLWLLNQADSKRCCGSRLATCSSNKLKSGYETVLTAACARQGCSATE